MKTIITIKELEDQKEKGNDEYNRGIDVAIAYIIYFNKTHPTVKIKKTK